MPSNAKNHKPNKPQKSRGTQDRRRNTIIAVCVVLTFWLITDLVGIGGNLRFYAKWIECGQKPIVRHINIGSVGPRTGPYYYEEAKMFALVRMSPDQYCTAIEAERDGLSADANNYRFPHLDAAGEDSPFLKSFYETLEN